VKFGYCECSPTGRGAVIRGYCCGSAVVGDSHIAFALGCGVESLVDCPSCGEDQADVECRRCQSVSLAGAPCVPREKLRIIGTPVRIADTVADVGRELSIEEAGWRGMIDVGEDERESPIDPVPGGFRNILASLFTWKEVGGPSTPIVTIMTSRSCTTT
jgi:hypothetical protein